MARNKKSKGVRPGPKNKIGDAEKQQVYAIVGTGASLRDAADFLGVDFKTLWNARKADPEFSIGVNHAVKAGKIKLLQKVGKSEAWQAAAWMLERRWGKEYGRKEAVSQTVTGTIKSRHAFDLSGFTDDELLKFERAFARGAGGTRVAGEGQPADVHQGGVADP